jgi:hypothetical protein
MVGGVASVSEKPKDLEEFGIEAELPRIITSVRIPLLFAGSVPASVF